MKKSIKVIVMMVAAVMMAGCEVGEGELMKTKTGHLMYLGWTDDINGIMYNIVEPAFNLNAWVQAPEEQKPEILQNSSGLGEWDFACGNRGEDAVALYEGS